MILSKHLVRSFVVWGFSFAGCLNESFANLYEEGLAELRAASPEIIVRSKLIPTLQSRKNASYYVVTPRTWASGKTILSVTTDDVGDCSVERLYPNGERKFLDHGAVDLYVDGGGCFCYNGKCYFQLEGGNGRLYTKSRYADRVDVGAMVYGPLKGLAKKVGLLLPKYSFKVSFRFCNGKKVVQLGRYPWDACVDRQLILEKIKQPLQNRSDKAWKIRHINKLKRKPKVVYGPVASIQKDTKGNFVIPMTPPPTMATSVWEEVVYEYHSDGFEEWSIPVGTIEHEKVKRLTRKFDYDYLRAEADRFKLEMEEERKATPPKVQEDAITKELEDGFLLFSDVEKCKGKSENNDAILVLEGSAAFFLEEFEHGSESYRCWR